MAKKQNQSTPLPITTIFSFVLLAFSLYFFVSLVTFNPNDVSLSTSSSQVNSIENYGGLFGAYLSDFLFSIIGASAYLLIALMVHEVLNILFFHERFAHHKTLRIISSFILIFCSCLLFEYFLSGEAYPQLSAGGVVGLLGLDFLSSYLGVFGALIFVVIFALASLSFALVFSWINVFDFIGKNLIGFLRIFLQALKKLSTLIFTLFKNSVNNFVKTIQNLILNFKSSRLKAQEAKVSSVKSSKSIEQQDEIERVVVEKSQNTPEMDTKIESVPEDIKNKAEPSNAKISTTVYKKKENVDTSMPDTSLLDRALDDGDSLTKDELNQLADLLESKLEEFGVEAKVVSVLPGPVVTRFEIQPAPGTKASKITNISQDIARSLAVSSVRVVEVIEGKSVVGIEIPNTNRKMVRLSEILSSDAFKNSTSPLSLALGHDIAGKSVVVDLAKMPHLLVAGTTGSGKSVGINAMLLSLLFKSDPSDVRLILIDPKMLELSVYDGIPHLLTPVITDMTDASNGLRWCVAEMDRRYKLMSEMGVRNLSGFNKKVAEAKTDGKPLFDPLIEDEETELEELPSIVVVVDEFADMMMLVGKKVEHLIARIAQKARAAGIHLILATQRPSVDVITGLIKANIPTRIGFQVSSKIDSRTILDQGGADQLLGYGDMLYLPAGQGVPVRVHGAFVGDDEVHRVVNDWKERAEPDYLEEITSELQETGPIPGWSNESSGSDSDENDELYDEAVNFVLESRRASISSVQRKLRIGYNRAARLIEAMEAAGLVSEMNTNGTREVLVPKR
jgi:S-DNA-T family DNA segregation ATPase FtsK/SpoIIIE